MEPFYFKSYDKIIATSHNLNELLEDMEKLVKENPESLKYHLEHKDIYNWLNYINEKKLATKLKNVADPAKAILAIQNYLKPKKSKK